MMAFEDEMDLLTIPSEYVPVDFAMDPVTDDLIFGDELEVGMVVLVEDLVTRETRDPNKHYDGVSDEHMAYIRAKADETARWCRIVRLRKDGEIITFVGLYSDGTKRTRTYNQAYAWFVKKNTINNSK